MSEVPPSPFVVLSYSPDDRALALRLKNDLLALGINVWPYQGSWNGSEFEQFPTYQEIRRAIEEAEPAAVIILTASNTDYHSERGRDEAEILKMAGKYHVPTWLISTDGAGVVESWPSRENIVTLSQAQSSYEELLAEIIGRLHFAGFVVKWDRLIIPIRISEIPLTAYNLTMAISALMELSTKYWLIAKGRFADLIEYTQTHDGHFVEEANVVVDKISYNSPMNMDWKVDLSAVSVAEAVITTIDGITQVRKRLEKAELENQAKAQEIKLVEQHADHEQQMAVLEREQQRLEVEQRRLEILEKQLEIQKKSIEYALEIASKVVDTLHPGADSATRAMQIQALLPNLIQLQNVKGLELALPAQDKGAEEKKNSL